ncbi:MAG: polysaccharide biosynthesis protein [Clostridiales bacterium]|jgi:stage V sporulation protein B|nr:polysaccharide biosynthesis protein [Clostridiales bacterium]
MDKKRGHSHSNSFVRQAAILAVAGIFARLLGFAYRLPLTDLIGDAGNYVYGVGYTVYGFLLVMSSAGLPGAIAKLVSERRAAGRAHAAHRLFKVALILSATIGLILSIIVFIFAEEITGIIFGMPGAALALQMLTPTVFIVAIMAVIRGYFQGMSSTIPTAASQLIEQIFNAIFSVILAHTLWNFAMERGYAEVYFGAAGGTLGSTVGAVAGFMVIAAIYFLLRRDIIQQVRRAARNAARREDTSYEKTGTLVKTILTTSTTMIIGTAIFSIVNLIDLWLVRSRMAVAGFGAEQINELFGQVLGKFNPITNLPAAISASLAIAIIPAIAAANALSKTREVHEKINTALRVGMLLTIPIAFGLATLGPQIVALLFPAHPEGGSLFLVGFPSIIFLTASQIATGVLQALSRAAIPILAAMVGALVKIAATFFLVAHPSINIYGVVIGTTLCYLVTATINCAILFKHTQTKPDFSGILLKPLFASAAMSLGAFTFYHSAFILTARPGVSTAIAVLAGMFLYAIFMLLIKGFKDSDILLLPGGEKLLAFLKSRGFI